MAAERKKVGGLGRGLSALLGEISTHVAEQAVTQTEESSASSHQDRRLALTDITPNPKQPRRRFTPEALQELADSIRDKGVLQPLLVRPNPDKNGPPFELIAGERRWRAAQLAGILDVPVMIHDLNDNDTLQIALIENIQRQDLNAIEEAEGYRRLIGEFGHSQETVGQLVGKSRSHITNLLRLLDLPESVRAMVIDGRLSMGHARALIGVPGCEEIALEVAKRGLSVRQVETLAKLAKAPPPSKEEAKTPPPLKKDADTKSLERDLTNTLGMLVEIAHKSGKGLLSVRYSSLDQLDDLCARLSRL